MDAETIKKLRELAEAATPGPWKAVSDPNWNSGNVYTSVQPVTVDEETMKPLAMMNGEHHVCRMSHTAAEWRFNYHRANAAFIAAANPAVILSLLDALDTQSSRTEAMRKALEEARDNIAHWGAYASEYFQEKHDLSGDLAEIDAVLDIPSSTDPGDADGWRAIETAKFARGERVCKTRGSSWQGRVVGFYSTDLTPIGYCVESERETGSVQLYPEAALEPAPPASSLREGSPS